jgi:hypothetical protein
MSTRLWTLLASAGLTLALGSSPAAERFSPSPVVPDGASSPAVMPPTLPSGITSTSPQPSSAPRLSPAQFKTDPTAGPNAPVPLIQPATDPAAPSIFEAAPVSRIYSGADYLFWWAKGAPLSVPLVSTGPIATTHHGLVGPPAMNAADTTILYGAPFGIAKGGHNIQDFPPFSGMRLTVGYWLDDAQRFAIEGSGFMLGRRSTGYTIRGDQNGNPVLGIPIYNSETYGGIFFPGVPPGEDSLPFALPSDPNRFRGDTGIITGGIKITNSLRLWGAEATGVVSLFRGSSLEMFGIVGFRYLDLSETFNLNCDIEGVSGQYVNQSGVVSDTFQTRNHFYGGIIGLRSRYSFDRLSFDLTGRVALGSNYEVQNVWGAFTSINYPTPLTTGSEGVFAQPANEGRRSGSRFAVVPEVQLKLGYAVTPRLRATLGYDFLYMTNVLRPGDQIDRNLPKGQTFNQAMSVFSSTSPAPMFNTTGFFAHGLSAGLEFSY